MGAPPISEFPLYSKNNKEVLKICAIIPYLIMRGKFTQEHVINVINQVTPLLGGVWCFKPEYVNILIASSLISNIVIELMNIKDEKDENFYELIRNVILNVLST